ncbi:MAG TPA: tetratricopeptide repeat protein [Gemmatimonadales bacterium]|nr:tetratricopeptide repeat protein [Gemmatimonadales bacterium]
MITTFRFTPAWLVAGLFVLAGCGDKSPKQANAKEPTPETSTMVVPPESTSTPSAPVGPVSFASAESSFRARRYDEAVAGFESYTSSRPTNQFGFYMLGLSAWKAGDLPKAEASLRQSIILDSTHVKSYLNLSRVLLDENQPDSAIGVLEVVLRIDETLGEAYRLIGRAHDAKGEPDRAVTAYHEALVLDSTDVWSMNNLGLVLIHQDAFDDAVRPLARAVELAPEVATFQNNLGIALERTGHFTAAADAYRAAIAADSGFSKAQVNLDRVAGLKEDPNIGPIDLKVLAQGFNAQIASWTTQEQ